MERVTARGLSDLVEVLPPTSSAEVLRLQREAHALLVLGRNLDKRAMNLLLAPNCSDIFRPDDRLSELFRMMKPVVSSHKSEAF